MKSKSQPPAVRNAKRFIRDAEASIRRRCAELGIDEAGHSQVAEDSQISQDESESPLRGERIGAQGYQDQNQGKPPLDERFEAMLRANRRSYAPETKSKAKSKAKGDKYGETAYNVAMGFLNNYLKSRDVPESLQPTLAGKIDRLVTAEITGREAAPAALPFAAALEAMTLKERRAALDAHYAARKKNPWAKAKSAKPTPQEFLAWLGDVFPDRREIGMVRSDLKYLDKDAYDKAGEWAGKRSKMPSAIMESFGLPIKTTKYDAERDTTALASAETTKFKKLRRSFERAQYHARLG